MRSVPNDCDPWKLALTSLTKLSVPISAARATNETTSVPTGNHMTQLSMGAADPVCERRQKRSMSSHATLMNEGAKVMGEDQRRLLAERIATNGTDTLRDVNCWLRLRQCRLRLHRFGANWLTQRPELRERSGQGRSLSVLPPLFDGVRPAERSEVRVPLLRGGN